MSSLHPIFSFLFVLDGDRLLRPLWFDLNILPWPSTHRHVIRLYGALSSPPGVDLGHRDYKSQSPRPFLSRGRFRADAKFFFFLLSGLFSIGWVVSAAQTSSSLFLRFFFSSRHSSCFFPPSHPNVFHVLAPISPLGPPTEIFELSSVPLLDHIFSIFL